MIKMLITLPFTSRQEKILTVKNMAAPFIALPISAAGYYLAEGILFGSFIAPMASLAGSLIQSVGSAVFFFVLASALDKAHIKGKTRQILHL